jgi:hypothetical protein
MDVTWVKVHHHVDGHFVFVKTWTLDRFSILVERKLGLEIAFFVAAVPVARICQTYGGLEQESVRAQTFVDQSDALAYLLAYVVHVSLDKLHILCNLQLLVYSKGQFVSVNRRHVGHF